MDRERVLIGFGGDTMLGRLMNRKISETSYFYPWGNLLPVLRETDLNIVNLETTLTTSHQKVPKVFNFKADPDKVQALIAAKIGVVSVANNHILDYREKGLLETLDTLDKAGIRHVGAGKNKAAASAPVILRLKEVKIGILACTDNEPGWEAGEEPGTNYLQVGDVEKLRKQLQPLREKVDLLILSYHWGPNMRAIPKKNFVDFAHRMVEMGVDILHGHSAHIFQGVETCKGSLIMYDTGDFVDDYVVDPQLRNDRSFFFLCEVDEKGVRKLRLMPTLISKMQVNFAEGEDYDWCMQRIQKMSLRFNTKVSEKGEVII